MDPRLLIGNIGYILGIIVTTGLSIFVLIKSPRRTTHFFFFLSTLFLAVFQLSHIIGVNSADPEIARLAFMFNISTLFTAAFTSHWMFAAIGRGEAEKYVLRFIYILLGGLTLFFALFPSFFMEYPVPKLYFPNYYVPGRFYFLGDIFFYFVIAYTGYRVFRAYIKSNYTLKNRIKYLSISLIIGYGVGSIPAFLLYDIKIDPLIASFFWLYTIPLAYAMIHEELLDIKVVAKKAFIYSFLVILAGLLISGVNYFNLWLVRTAPEFPLWVGSFLFGLFVVVVARFFFKKLRESDELKYEFVNVVTHKFRTPLTYIKWSMENLRGDVGKEEKEEALAKIDAANMRMVELTNVLLETSETESKSYAYHFEKVDINEFIRGVVKEFDLRIKEKSITFSFEPQEEKFLVPIDHQRFESVIQILLDNAIIYNVPQGFIAIKTWSEGHAAYCSVANRGIGFSKEEMKFLFNKFYRTPEATRAATEGMGVGLFIAKSIVERHGGKIYAESKGNGEGATFTVKLPL